MKLSVSYANHLLLLIRKRGDFSLNELNFDIDEEILENESNLFDHHQIFPLIEKIRSLYPKKCVGLYVGHNQTLSTWGRTGFAIMTCKTLYDAISIGLKYHRTTTMLVSLAFKLINKEYSEIVIKPLIHDKYLQPFCFESTIASLLSIYTQITHKKINLIRIDLNYDLSESEEIEYRNYFNCEINFGRTNTKIHFSLPENTNLNMFDAANSKMFLQKVIDRNEELKSNSLITTIRKIISKGNGKYASLSQLSKELNISTSLLEKRLKESGVSYRKILESAKQQTAIKHLQSSHKIKMYEVAFLSGYSDLSNFRKAFLRWQGITPSDFKKKYQLP